MIAKVTSSLVLGVDGIILDIEVDIAAGLPVFATVGLPDNAVRESKDRVKAAIKNSGYEFPSKRITVNMAPADVKKEGSGYDLPIAIGLLSANGLIPQDQVKSFCIIGELSLDGSVRAIRGVLPRVLSAKEAGVQGVIVPQANLGEALMVEGIRAVGVESLIQAVQYIRGEIEVCATSRSGCEGKDNVARGWNIDFADVAGQEHVKRALEIAACGNHNVLMKGPPGTGKTMLAKRIATILPLMRFEESIETTKIHSIAGMLKKNEGIVRQRPFRSPHHTISDAGLIGGGSVPQPGEVSLATNGILFLDELTEFRKNNLEMLRQPLEDRVVTISRASMTLTFPANFLLIAACNPCPCGYYGDKRHDCTCTPQQRQKYLGKISGPLMDRIDMHLDVPALSYEEISNKSTGEKSVTIRKRVEWARDIQNDRFGPDCPMRCNALMGTKEIKKYCELDEQGSMLMRRCVENLGISVRGFHRILKIARTIADMDSSPTILKHHLAEAIHYRRDNLIFE